MASNNDSFLTKEQEQILRKSALCAKLDDEQATYFFEVVRRTRLDPFTGQIRADIRSSKQSDGTKIPTLIIITTLQGLRVIGNRTNQHDGESEIEWTGKNGEWHNAWLPEEPPVAARVSVFRKDRTHPQIAVVRFDAFCQYVYDKQGNQVPNAFWARMASLMLGKCALAAAYRGAYPDFCSGLYISEELREELDKDSEEAIEAEMIRRARDEKLYWEEQAQKGIYPIDEQQRRQKEEQTRPAITKQEKPTDRKVASSDKVMTGAELFNRPAPAPLPTPQPSSPTGQAPSPSTAENSWQNFVITRIDFFKGRTLGSLTENEVNGLKGWMERVKASWGSLDEDFKAHYAAIQQRMDDDYQKELDKLAEGNFELT